MIITILIKYVLQLFISKLIIYAMTSYNNHFKRDLNVTFDKNYNVLNWVLPLKLKRIFKIH